MDIPKELLSFLNESNELNKKFNSVKTNNSFQPLHHCFWNSKEVESSLKIRSDWDVEENLIPFYGDWHNLFCLENVSLKIIELDDERKVLNTWSSLSELSSSLCWVEEDSSDDLGIVEANLDF